mmetsp:Transcript_27037/g.54633  ORF Transcript_27037/g.54633 Transcript_27037/m.54633 type:complete len:277 (-) Transcript_27037:420-1250(-)
MMSALLSVAIGCIDQMSCCTSSYSNDQVETEIIERECVVRNDAYWRVVEEALSAKDSEDDTSQKDDMNKNRMSVDAFMPPIEESPSPSVASTFRSKAIEPLVLSPSSTAVPPLSNMGTIPVQRAGSTSAKYVMDMPNELKGRGGRASRVRSLMPSTRRKWNFRTNSRACLDYHSLGSVSSYQRRSKLLAETDEASLASLSTAMSTEPEVSLTNSQRSSGDMLSPARSSTEIKRSESRLEAKLRTGSYRAHRPSMREIMDESVHSLPYLTMSQGFEV